MELEVTKSSSGLLVRVPICEKVESHLLIDETPYFEVKNHIALTVKSLVKSEVQIIY